MNLKKRYYLLFLLFCLCLGMVISHFGWTKQWYYFVLPLVLTIVLGSMSINLSYHFYYSRKINSLLALVEERQYSSYLEAIEAIRRRVKSQYLNYLCVLNKAAVYDNMGEFEQSLALLRTIPEKKLSTDIQPVYHLNLATSYFHTGQSGKGLAYYKRHMDVILELAVYPQHQPYVEVLKLYVMLETGQRAEARVQLAFIKEHFDLESIHEDFEHLEEKAFG